MSGLSQNPPASPLLADEPLQPCPRGTPSLSGEQSTLLLNCLTDWSRQDVDGIPRLVKVFRFADFRSALAFANRVGEIAEEAGHHPALLVEWGRVTVSWWTHDIGGLHRNDFLMAARTAALQV
jgi:4a-hydroxytetrahydrobiopterin dehydratase